MYVGKEHTSFQNALEFMVSHFPLGWSRDLFFEFEQTKQKLVVQYKKI